MEEHKQEQQQPEGEDVEAHAFRVRWEAERDANEPEPKPGSEGREGTEPEEGGKDQGHDGLRYSDERLKDDVKPLGDEGEDVEAHGLKVRWEAERDANEPEPKPGSEGREGTEPDEGGKDQGHDALRYSDERLKDDIKPLGDEGEDVEAHAARVRWEAERDNNEPEPKPGSEGREGTEPDEGGKDQGHDAFRYSDERLKDDIKPLATEKPTETEQADDHDQSDTEAHAFKVRWERTEQAE